MKKVFGKLAHHYKDIPNKKPYIEFFAALLTIPVLLTVILLNLNSLKGNKDTKAPAPVTQERVYVTIPGQSANTQVTKAPSEPCKPGIGQVTIASPDENETVTDNPVQVSITYKNGGFCEVVWSYRINGGQWSSYDDASVALYNPPQGAIKLDLRIKSVVNSETDSLTRNFTYKGSSTPSASSSAN